MKSWKDNVYFVLVEPREPGNIGASARAIKNMGFINLCLVNPAPFMTDEAEWLAHNAKDILETAKVYKTVYDAVNKMTIVAGTSRRTGKRRGVFMNAEQAAGRLFDIAKRNKVAVLFGREDRGLFNEEVEECGFLITIPASRKHPSLNLAQAVMIVSYELSQTEYINDGLKIHPRKEPAYFSEAPIPKLACHGEISALYSRIENTLEMLDYLPRGDRKLGRKIMLNLKHFMGRAGITDCELRMLHGICSQIEKKIKK